ncbi:MAG: hypothetical protein M0R74_12815 [Dehalococcoidia bacterium]|nr:hypothetical protein [Dehalococcoidia bacterium]
MNDVRSGDLGLSLPLGSDVDPRVAALLAEFERRRADRDADPEMYLQHLADLRDQIAQEEPQKLESLAVLDEVLSRFDKGLGTTM